MEQKYSGRANLLQIRTVHIKMSLNTEEGIQARRHVTLSIYGTDFSIASCIHVSIELSWAAWECIALARAGKKPNEKRGIW